jgi:bacterioferritin-associated ferredoxin
MIVCSCNVFSDHDVRSAVNSAEDRPVTCGQVYGCLGCSAQCGRCARTIRKIMDEALKACPAPADVACAHVHIHAETE